MYAALVLALAFAQAAPPPSLDRGVAELRAGRVAEAERHLNEALRQAPDSFEGHYYLGVLQFQTGRLADAARALSRAVELAPKSARAAKALGGVHAAQGNFQLAEPHFRRACEIDPREEAACYYLGRNLYAQNRFDPALAAFEKALASDAPKNRWMAHRGIALTFEALGRATDAERHFQEAIRTGAGNWRAAEDPRVDYGVFLFRQGRTGEAVTPLEAAAADFPDSARHCFELGRALAQLGRLEPAAARLERAVKLDPTHWAAHLLLGKTYIRLGQPDKAQPHLDAGAKGVAEQELK